MHDSVVVQVLYGQSNLVRELFDALLSKFEIACLNVVEQVTSLHVLEYDVVELAVFKQVYETNDIRMLAHLEYFNFSSLLVDFNLFHVLLIYCFDGDLLTILLVSSKLDRTKLPFPKVILEVVEVKHVGVSDSVSQMGDPLMLELLVLEVQKATLVWRQNNFDRIQAAAFALTDFERHLFDEGSNQ